MVQPDPIQGVEPATFSAGRSASEETPASAVFLCAWSLFLGNEPELAVAGG
jgi:hypothetical protein